MVMVVRKGRGGDGMGGDERGWEGMGGDGRGWEGMGGEGRGREWRITRNCLLLQM